MGIELRGECILIYTFSSSLIALVLTLRVPSTLIEPKQNAVHQPLADQR